MSEPVLSLIFIAKRLRQATDLEAVLTAAQIDYHVEPDEYIGGFVFKTKRIGAFFYVEPEDRQRAVEVMLKNGYEPALTEDEPLKPD